MKKTVEYPFKEKLTVCESCNSYWLVTVGYWNTYVMQ